MIRIRDLNINLKEFNLFNINLDIGTNEFFILMGPTGAGKTVLLEAIAGLIPVKSGSIYIGEKNVTALAPEKRGVSIVYQDYSLFPHLTVRENIRYGLHFHKINKDRSDETFDRLVEDLNLSYILNRFPLNLSGGELQRAAMARALMVEPEILLLDEPLSALDPGFREEIRAGLKKLHRDSNVTFLMVTHDFAEALSLSDRAAMMNNGKIIQTGTMEDIFKRPDSTFVADFVGMKNLFAAQFRETKALTGNLEIELGAKPVDGHGYIAIRPEDIVLSRRELTSSMRNSFEGNITEISDYGLYYEAGILVRDITFKSLITKSALLDLQLAEGTSIFVSFKSTAIHTF